MERVRRGGPLWAFLAAAGASYLVTGAALVVRELLLWPARELETLLTDRMLYFGGLADPVLMTIAVSCGTFAAGYVARRAGGVRGVALYGAFLAVAIGLLVAHAFEQERLVRSGPGFSIVTLYDMPLTAAGIGAIFALSFVAGIALARGRATAGGCNAALEVAGTYALVAVGGVAAFGIPAYRQLFLAPFATIALDGMSHAAVAAAQILAAAVVFTLRRPDAAIPRTLATFAAAGLAGVAFADVGALWGVAFFHHTYVPLSLVLVPLGSAFAGLAVATAVRSLRVATPA